MAEGDFAGGYGEGGGAYAREGGKRDGPQGIAAWREQGLLIILNEASPSIRPDKTPGLFKRI